MFVSAGGSEFRLGPSYFGLVLLFQMVLTHVADVVQTINIVLLWLVLMALVIRKYICLVL